jgi:hypothetical protein
MTHSKQSRVVLLARVDDPVKMTTVGNYCTIVTVEHDEHALPSVVAEMALELAPDVTKWGLFR